MRGSKGGSVRPLERGTKNHKRKHEVMDLKDPITSAQNKVFKKTRNKKRRAFDTTETPGF